MTTMIVWQSMMCDINFSTDDNHCTHGSTTNNYIISNIDDSSSDHSICTTADNGTT